MAWVWRLLVSIGVVGSSALLSWWAWPQARDCPPLRGISYRLEKAIRVEKPVFVEGLVFRAGWLYESSGLYGRSAIYRLHPGTGAVRLEVAFPGEVFAEGLDYWMGRFLALTWKEGQVFEWGEKFGLPIDIRPYSFEGWGLTHDGESWIASDGTAVLHFLSRFDLKETRKIEVRTDSGPVDRLNELEFAQGSVFANIFQSDRIARVDPATGCVTGELDLAPLRALFSADDALRIASDDNSVANGIAFDPSEGVFYLSGKNWPLIFKIRIASDLS